MSEEYVRKDVHDAEMRRIDERIDATVSRIEASLNVISRDVKKIEDGVNDLCREISALEAKVSGISNNLMLIMAGFVLAFSAIAFSISLRFLR